MNQLKRRFLPEEEQILDILSTVYCLSQSQIEYYVNHNIYAGEEPEKGSQAVRKLLSSRMLFRTQENEEIIANFSWSSVEIDQVILFWGILGVISGSPIHISPSSFPYDYIVECEGTLYSIIWYDTNSLVKLRFRERMEKSEHEPMLLIIQNADLPEPIPQEELPTDVPYMIVKVKVDYDNLEGIPEIYITESESNA